MNQEQREEREEPRWLHAGACCCAPSCVIASRRSPATRPAVDDNPISGGGKYRRIPRADVAEFCVQCLGEGKGAVCVCDRGCLRSSWLASDVA